jgi:hypothetical protein
MPLYRSPIPKEMPLNIRELHARGSCFTLYLACLRKTSIDVFMRFSRSESHLLRLPGRDSTSEFHVNYST